MKKNYHWIIILFVPANCTSKLQPADVVHQRTLKYHFKQGFNLWLAGEISKQIAGGVADGDVKCDFRIGVLREGLCGWLLDAWRQLADMKEMTVRGWAKCGLIRPFDREFQNEALEHQTELFRQNIPAVQEGSEDPTEEQEAEEVYEWQDDLTIAELQELALMEARRTWRAGPRQGGT
jgi:hypothetical protein